jgi:hypothetical protein
VRESGSLAARSQKPTRQCRDPSAAVQSPTAAALELHASCRDGCTQAIMLAYGFSIDMMVELCRARNRECRARVAGGRPIEVARVRISEAGGGRSYNAPPEKLNLAKRPPPGKCLPQVRGKAELGSRIPGVLVSGFDAAQY